MQSTVTLDGVKKFLARWRVCFATGFGRSEAEQREVFLCVRQVCETDEQLLEMADGFVASRGDAPRPGLAAFLAYVRKREKQRAIAESGQGEDKPDEVPWPERVRHLRRMHKYLRDNPVARTTGSAKSFGELLPGALPMMKLVRRAAQTMAAEERREGVAEPEAQPGEQPADVPDDEIPF